MEFCDRLGASIVAEGPVKPVLEMVEHQEVRCVSKDDTVLETAQRIDAVGGRAQDNI